MSTPLDTSHYTYDLPEDRIATEPLEPRDSSKLMVIDRENGSITHTIFRGITKLLRPGDLLVVNNSKVFKCRLRGVAHGKNVELFLLREENGLWHALAQPGKILSPQSKIELPSGIVAAVEQKEADGTIRVSLPLQKDDVLIYTEQYGEVPLPPYIMPNEKADHSYQTAYAQKVGSAAAPTAGFHFTSDLLKKIQEHGIKIAPITLHVGLGTFQPIKTDTLEAHAMHEEIFEIPDTTRELIKETKKNGGRVIAVGTTSLRALESDAVGKKGQTNLFITPGYQFKVVDALITNFHLPKSTLLVLVRTFGGDDLIMRAYQEALEQNYRFYSYGDAMFIQ